MKVDPKSLRIYRNGVSRLDVVIVVLVLTLLVSLASPWVLRLREQARQAACANNMKQLVAGMRAYHDTHSRLPPAAIWDVNATYSLALHESDRVERITKQNWLQLILPQIGESDLAAQFDPTVPIGHVNNEQARTTWVGKFKCPSDTFYREDNPHRFYPVVGEDQYIEFARGNYAVNGGTHNYELTAPSTQGPQGDFCHLVMSEKPRRYEMWGNGIAGINKSFSFEDFTNSQSTTIAIEEIRTGVHEIDPRGVWALGQVGGSITWGHGVNGDTFSPNNQDFRADDILRAKELHQAVGSDQIEALGMPTCSYVDRNQQSTARSMHQGGVNVAFVDGSVKFISDNIDPGLWHVLHSRETPPEELSDWKLLADTPNFAEDSTTRRTTSSEIPKSYTNSLGMEFVKIPAGTYEMGLANNDRNLGSPICPAREVEISQDFLISIYEVTREQFAMADNQEIESASDIATLPITEVTWYEAQTFCERISKADPNFRYRLPTEAEWEYVCRGGSTEPYDWNLTRQPNDQSGDAAGITPWLPLTPVGTYPPNTYGVYDMRGNAWEWTHDWFDRDYYQRSRKTDPFGPELGFIKVVRGSDWRFIGEPCLLDYPMHPPWKKNPFVGFRVVCEPTDSSLEDPK